MVQQQQYPDQSMYSAPNLMQPSQSIDSVLQQQQQLQRQQQAVIAQFDSFQPQANFMGAFQDIKTNDSNDMANLRSQNDYQ